MKKRFSIIIALILFTTGLTVLANSTFNIDGAFFSSTNIDSGDYSAIHFGYNSNNIDGVIFRGGKLNNTGQLIMSGTTINCDKQLKGLYINTARGNKVWPLDQTTLLELSGSSSLSGYNTLTMTGGFWTECSGTGIGSGNIYGYIEHGYNGNIYKLWAGIDYNFASGSAIASYSGTLAYISGSNITASGYLFDNIGGIATVYPSTNLDGNINWTGSNISSTGTTTQTGVQVSIYSNQDSIFELSGDIVNSFTGTLVGGSAVDKNILLTNGTGVKNILLTISTGGNIITRNIDITLIDTTTGTGSGVGTGSGSGSVTTGDTVSPIVHLVSPINGYTTTGDTVYLQWSGSDDISISKYELYVNGPANYIWPNISASVNAQTIPSLQNGIYNWHVLITDSSGNTGSSNTYTFTITGVVSSGVTNAISLISPISGANVTLGQLDIVRSGNSNSGYTWQFSDNNNFNNIVASGDTNQISGSILQNPQFMTGTFYWRVIDKESAIISNIHTIHILDITGGVDLSLSSFDFDDEDNADLSESYQSNEITIGGISDNIYISASLKNNIGALFINDTMVGTHGLVKNGDKIYIELISSNEYDDSVKAELIVGEGDNQVSEKYKVYTKEKSNNINLSYTQKLQTIVLLNSLIDMYGKDSKKLEQFLTTFQVVLQDKIDLLDKDIDDEGNSSIRDLLKRQKSSLSYLYDIIDEYISDIPYEDTSVYIAPNGKQYLVEYDERRFAYTSPDFINRKYFPSRETFVAHIDRYNPGSYHAGHNSEIINAPNGKVYHVKQSNGKRVSDDFIYRKYFDTREQIVDYIFANNSSNTWDHSVDTNFNPVSFVAPNGKKYTIFKTSSTKGSNRNKYSSFKFITAKYFSSLQAVKNHIISMNK